MTNASSASAAPPEGYVTIEYSHQQRLLKAALPLAIALGIAIAFLANPLMEDLIATLLWCAGMLYWAWRLWRVRRRTVPEVIHVPPSALNKNIGIAILIAAPLFALWAAIAPGRSEAESVFIGALTFCFVAPFAWLFLKKNEEYTPAARRALGLPDPPPKTDITWADISAFGSDAFDLLKSAAVVIFGLAVIGISIFALNHAVSSAPWWAVVIIVLLILILLK
mgnify:CR=1 FL=1